MYDAFVSYSHAADGSLAPAVRDGLEQLAKPWNRRRALRVFLDSSGLGMSDELWPAVRRALDESRFFVLLASPEATRSEWVNREVAYWRATKPPGHLLLAVTGGDLVWDAERGDFAPAESSAMPPELAGVFTAEEPRWVDLRGLQSEPQLSLQHSGFRRGVADLAARIRGASPDEIEGEDLRQFKRGRLVRRVAAVALTALTVLAVGAGTLALRNAQQARRNAAISDARRLAAEAVNVGRADAGVLLALESLRTRPTADGWSALRFWLAQDWALRAVTGQEGPARTTALSPDGELLAYTSHDGHFQLWDAATGELSATQLAYRGEALDAAGRPSFSRDGKQLAAAVFDDMDPCVVGVWDLGTGGEPVETIERVDCSGLVFSADGGELLLWRSTGIEVVDLRTGNRERVWRPPRAALVIERAGYDAAGAMLAVTRDPDGPWVVWRGLDGGAPEAITLDVPTEGEIRAYSWAQDLIAGRAGGVLFVIDGVTGDVLWEEPAHVGLVIEVAFDASGAGLATTGADGTVRRWDARTGQQIRSPLELENSGRGLAVGDTIDQIAIVAPGIDRLVYLAVNRTGEGVVLTGHAGPVTALDVDPGGTVLASGGADGTVRLWDAQGPGPLEPPLGEHEGTVAAVAFDPEGARVASAGEDGAVRLWDVATQVESTLCPRYHFGGARDVLFREEGGLVSLGGDGVRVWNSDGCAAGSITGSWESLTLLASGRLLATTSDPDDPAHGTGFADLLDVEGEQVVETLDRRVRYAAVSPDGSMTALAYGDVEVWDAPGGRRLAGPLRERTGTGTLGGMAFSPDGSFLSQGDFIGPVRIWHVESGATVEPDLVGHVGEVSQVVFSADGQLIASAGELDGTIRLWDGPDRWIPAACALAGRNMTRFEWDTLVGPGHPYVRHCAEYPEGRNAPEDAPAAEYEF